MQDKIFHKNIQKAQKTIEKQTTKKGDAFPQVICVCKEPYMNGEKGAKLEFMVGGPKGGHYTCQISFHWYDDFQIDVFTDCDYLKKNKDEIILYALKTFTPIQEKQAKKYFVDLIYELAEIRMEGKA